MSHPKSSNPRSLPLYVEPERRQWRSIEELRGSSELAEAAVREFPPGASEMDGVTRRGFMQLLGASAAIAGVGAACTRPNDKIVPFVRRPEEVTPGNPLHFATAAVHADGFATGLLVASYEGRPTKIEGNPDHPTTVGASSAVDQALIRSLYDDQRAKQLRRHGKPVAWRTFLQDVAGRAAAMEKDGGARLRFLVEPTSSQVVGELRARILKKLPNARFVTYSSLASEGEAQGARLAFGRPLQARYHLDKAAVILSLDADFLSEGPEVLRLSREFAARRVPGPDMNRLYAVEPALSLTGGMAEHRLRRRGSEVGAVALSLAAELARKPGLESLSALGGLAAPGGGADGRWVGALARDLERHRGRCVVIAGRRQPAYVHAVAHALNAALGAIGTTVSFVPPVVDAGVEPTGLSGLAGDIAAGKVETLVITAFNPAYTAPADLQLGKLLARVPDIIYWSLHEDETAAVAGTLVPAAHLLESWGDARALDGTASIIQPLVAPLWGGFTEAETLAAWLGEGDLGAHQITRRFWQARSKDPLSFDRDWEKWLADGVIPGSASAPESGVTVDPASLAGAVRPLLKAPPGTGVEVAFAVDSKVLDGRYATNAWLQELPDPITKLTWDNAVLMSPKTAEELGVATDRAANAHVVEVQSRGRTVEGPVVVQPGHVDGAVTLVLGYGRRAGNDVARGAGFDAGAVRFSDAPWFDRSATIVRKDRRYELALTQDHWVMAPDGRNIPRPAMETTLAQATSAHSEFAEEIAMRRGPLPTVHEPVDYSKQPYKWAMSIDLSKCTGCSACVVACQSENNIPSVGKEQVGKGREMHWLRIDRYFSGSPQEPEMITQPLLCVHCETAPCEYVCPVNATVHSDEGLNEMVYNRCIGTRYCSNNCPYKVRRFNFLEYNGDVSAVRKMGMNPDVTVRSRGVMEKCTYCVQRIERKRIESRVQGRAIADGELQTACQQTCPADAIVFGSLNDPNARVSRMHADPRRYDLLHELNTRPRTAYLARVRNPNPELARNE